MVGKSIRDSGGVPVAACRFEVIILTGAKALWGLRIFFLPCGVSFSLDCPSRRSK